MCIRDRDIADLLEVYLKNENYIVHKFYCATDAMSCIESGNIDLAILDIMLPDMNGFSLCQLIRKDVYKRQDLLMPQGRLLRRGRSDSFTPAKPEEDAVGNQ